jgi:hypothetical protein
MNQIVIGASLPFLIAAVIYVRNGLRAGRGLLVGTPLFMLLGALWAVVPDLPRLWQNKALYDRLARDPRMNVFFFHYSIDQMESYSAWWFVAFMLMAAALLAMAWRELQLAEKRARDRYV